MVQKFHLETVLFHVSVMCWAFPFGSIITIAWMRISTHFSVSQTGTTIA